MRILIQRVKYAKVEVDDRPVSSIGPGMLILVGVAEGDTDEDALYLAKKASLLRIFDDENGVMNLSVQDIGGSILSVSQFTLLAETRKGNRPSYIKAARPEEGRRLYDLFNGYLSDMIKMPVGTGEFGADMAVSLLNDGPVTIWMDSRV